MVARENRDRGQWPANQRNRSRQVRKREEDGERQRKSERAGSDTGRDRRTERTERERGRVEGHRVMGRQLLTSHLGSPLGVSRTASPGQRGCGLILLLVQLVLQESIFNYYGKSLRNSHVQGVASGNPPSGHTLRQVPRSCRPIRANEKPSAPGPLQLQRPAGVPACCPDGSSRCPGGGCVGNIFKRLAISGSASSTLPHRVWLMR